MLSAQKFDKKYFSSGVYRNYQEILNEWVGETAKRIYQLLKNEREPKVLDVGCSFGNLIAELQDKYDFKVAGLEYSSYAIQKALSSVKRKIKKGSILKPPFKENNFDAVVCFDVIYYFTPRDAKKVIGNLVKLSRKYIFFNTLYRHSKESSQRHNPDPLRMKPLSRKEYLEIFFQNNTKLIKSFYSENGGEILIFKKNS